MIDFEKRKLDNGLTVIVEQDTTTQMAAVNVLYKVGSRNESPRKTGFAHLFEHLMFGGSIHIPDFDIPIQAAGGENNAFTNSDYTNYYDVLPAQNIETALWAEADRMANLIMNEKALEVQKKVVIEEFKEVCLNKPYGDSWHHLSALAFRKHPYRWPTIGLDISHVASASLHDVRDFFKCYYQPQNAILSISSPLSKKRMFDLADKWFSSIENNQAIKDEIESEPVQLQERIKVINGKVPSPIFMLAFHMPGRKSRAYYACDLLSDILANGKSSRFYLELIKKRRIMSHADCYITGSFDPGLIIIEGRPLPGVSIETCSKAVWDIIQELHEGHLPEHELQKVKNKISFTLSTSDLSPLNRAISMAYFEWLGELESINEQDNIYQSITSEEVIHMAKDYMTRPNMSQLNYLPSQIPSS